MAELDVGAGRKVFTRAGFALLVFLVSCVALQFASVQLIGMAHIQESWIQNIFVLLPQYVIAMPLAFWVLSKIPSPPVVKKKMRTGKLFLSMLICFAIMYAGNLAGKIVNLIIEATAQSSMSNTVEEFILGQSVWFNLAFVVLVAPVMEELFFRKLLISKLMGYGEKPAVILSGLAFGLIHGNLSQFFYAFGLGLAFGYIFVKTGKVIYTIILHMAVNFLGGVLAPLVLSSYWVITMLYGLVVLAAAIVGFMLFIINRKNIVMSAGLFGIPRGKSAVYLNAGMILFFVSSAAFFVVNTYQMF